ncbi:MAG TPA: hypothetical protein VF095_02080 [Bacillota bacterium]
MYHSPSLTPHQNLRSLFERDIHVTHISEVLRTCHVNDNTTVAKRMIKTYDFDCLGVEDDGRVVGYIDKANLGQGTCYDYMKLFKAKDIVSETTSLMQTLYLFKQTNRLFILEGNQIRKLVTTADLQKTPVQLFLFGLVSLVEMYMLQMIKIYLPNDMWKPYVKEARIAYAEAIFQQRKEQNEAIELSDCLQWCDKRDIVIHDERLFKRLQFPSKNKAHTFLGRLERLRNQLAHAQPFMGKFSTKEIIALVEQTERFLSICEEVLVDDVRIDEF